MEDFKQNCLGELLDFTVLTVFEWQKCTAMALWEDHVWNAALSSAAVSYVEMVPNSVKVCEQTGDLIEPLVVLVFELDALNWLFNQHWLWSTAVSNLKLILTQI